MKILTVRMKTRAQSIAPNGAIGRPIGLWQLGKRHVNYDRAKRAALCSQQGRACPLHFPLTSFGLLCLAPAGERAMMGASPCKLPPLRAIADWAQPPLFAPL